MKPVARKRAAWLTIAVALIAGEEGLRHKAYLDPVKIPTYCFGETYNRAAGRPVKLGDRASTDECKAMLEERVEQDFGQGVDRCIKNAEAVPPERKAAYVSLAYNIGVAGFCASSIARKANAGDVRGSCDAFLLYNKARMPGVGLIELPGLTKRRRTERELCLQGA